MVGSCCRRSGRGAEARELSWEHRSVGMFWNRIGVDQVARLLARGLEQRNCAADNLEKQLRNW